MNRPGVIWNSRRSNSTYGIEICEDSINTYAFVIDDFGNEFWKKIEPLWGLEISPEAVANIKKYIEVNYE